MRTAVKRFRRHCVFCDVDKRDGVFCDVNKRDGVFCDVGNSWEFLMNLLGTYCSCTITVVYMYVYVIGYTKDAVQGMNDVIYR